MFLVEESLEVKLPTWTGAATGAGRAGEERVNRKKISGRGTFPRQMPHFGRMSSKHHKNSLARAVSAAPNFSFLKEACQNLRLSTQIVRKSRKVLYFEVLELCPVIFEGISQNCFALVLTAKF